MPARRSAALWCTERRGDEPETGQCAERKEPFAQDRIGGDAAGSDKRLTFRVFFVERDDSVSASIGHRSSNSRLERGGDVLCSPLRQCVGTGLQDRLSH